MATRRVDGTALLVAGHPAQPGALDASAVHTLGQIGEALLATGVAWQIKRLVSGEQLDRATLKRHVDELVAEPARVAIVVLLGSIVQTSSGPALVTGAHAQEYPDDAALPLTWIRDRLYAANAEQLVVILSADGPGVPRAWFDALATERKTHVVAVEASTNKHPTVDALLTGLCGEALDPRTGTVTMASLSDYIAKFSAELQPSNASETIAQPPPLAGLWDVRRSQLAQRSPKKTVDDDLTGAVLPGRFRLDRLVARGTFGTVYRARQLAVERDVAVKVLHADIDPSSEDGRLFVHEIRSVGRIDCANVVRIHQADITHDGRLFFAMELLDGQDLQSLGTQPRERVVELGRQLLAGLQAAHDAGLVHADVKPANALLASERGGRPDAAMRRPGDKADERAEKDDRSDRSSGRGGDRLVLVDFGLSRLRAPDRPTASAGGTPAYMAPEQLHEGRVDARSDLFSAALVLVFLLTGWRRPNAFSLVPSLEIIEDANLREVLGRALSSDPAKRYPTAREFAEALTGVAQPGSTTVAPALPFRHLAPLTEVDRDRLYGRETDLATLAEAVLFRRSVIYTAPSGTGKTSMLRAGLLPRLEALGVRAIYHRCRADSAASLVAAIVPAESHTDGLATLPIREHDPNWVADATVRHRQSQPITRPPAIPTVAAAIAAWHESGGNKLVLVLDQLEAALVDHEFIESVLAFDKFPPGADVSVVLSVREDYLARLVAQTQAIEPNIPVVRLPPLAPSGASAAIVGPLTEARLAIEPELLATLLDDLVGAAAAIGPEMGWGTSTRAVYPPHLQLACSVLYEALGSGEATLTLAHYRALGGFDAIVGEHLDRVLDTELADGRDVIARDLFVALVTTAQERAVRSESELLAIVSSHRRDDVIAVLELLRSRGLIVRLRGDRDDDPSWELIHDSLVPRVLQWVDRRDLDRRRAIELVRYHLRRSRPESPSLLGRAELRELAPHHGAIADLDAEWKKRGGAADEWTPAGLVARSHQVIRRRVLTFSSILFAALALASIGMYRSHIEEVHAREEARLKMLDLGRFTLSLDVFDWDADRLTAIPAAIPPTLSWKLHHPDRADAHQAGEPFDSDSVVHGAPVITSDGLVENVEARGGSAFLVIERGACAPSTIPLRNLPGYAQRDAVRVTVSVHVPTCAASRVDTIEMAATEFYFGGPGEPPSAVQLKFPDFSPEIVGRLSAFRVDRTEVTNAAFDVFARMSALTNIGTPRYPNAPGLQEAGAPRRPVSGIDWYEARAFCRFFGKDLPSSQQWTRVLRGGIHGDHPRRNLPWIETNEVAPAKLSGIGTPGAADVGSYPLDRTPDGVVDLAGNVQEWTCGIL